MTYNINIYNIYNTWKMAIMYMIATKRIYKPIIVLLCALIPEKTVNLRNQTIAYVEVYVVICMDECLSLIFMCN